MGKYMTLKEKAEEYIEQHYEDTSFRTMISLAELKERLVEFTEENKPAWHYTDDLLPPDPQEDSSEGFTVCKALIYICAYKLRDGGYETGEFMYLGNGEWVGENEEYPIYAWLDCPMTVPRPREEG